MRLIDADALADAMFEKRKNYPQWVADEIGNAPVVDAVQIVRCKDCKHGRLYDNGMLVACDFEELSKDPDWFCADGEAKE